MAFAIAPVDIGPSKHVGLSAMAAHAKMLETPARRVGLDTVTTALGSHGEPWDYVAANVPMFDGGNKKSHVSEIKLSSDATPAVMKSEGTRPMQFTMSNKSGTTPT
jgi:hypothetical protein